ncbi:chemotaxis protein CheA [Roseimarinus sediminis]|uniref:chemotaxis protein CheA n=1 Tax=Roseimarinus sediminis TaxID=1610899 RepID=UPI003D1B198C
MADSIDQLRVSFVEETRDLINELEDVLLSLEVDAVDNETIDQIFRSVHTIKGSGGMLGFEKVLEVTHDLEDIYDKVRSGDAEFTMQLKDISLETIDMLKVLLESDEQLNDNDKIRFADLCRKIELFEVDTTGSQNENTNKKKEIQPVAASDITYLVKVNPLSKKAKATADPVLLIKELLLLGPALVFTKNAKEVQLNQVDKARAGDEWLIVLSNAHKKEAIDAIFEWSSEQLSVSITALVKGNLLAIDEAKAELEQLGEKIFTSSNDELAKIAERYRHRMMADEEEKNNRNRAAKAADENGQAAAGVISSIRVSTEKIDQLMNLVSEMVTLQARLDLIADESDNEDLKAVAEKYGSFSKQLRDNAFTISLVPFGVTITRYKRLVHDLSEQLGKKVEFITEGEDTVLDKKIIEQLSDPIMHILRNSVDHGIENSEERTAAGKDEAGNIHMKIYHQSNNVVIRITDDGSGIDPEKMRATGIKKGFITADQVLTDNELINLIFLPGFSSAKAISNVSGRGVGLDVVKKNISEIRGAIEIQSEKGKGTTFIIKLPLTLSIIDGLQVKIDERIFIIPLIQVEKIISLTNFVSDSTLNQVMTIEGEQYPFFDLRSDFNIGGEVPARREIVMVSYENERVALIVDAVTGENQTVLKPLGKHYKNQNFISGGTILGDGSVALVLDVNKIVTEFSKK